MRGAMRKPREGRRKEKELCGHMKSRATSRAKVLFEDV